MDNFERFKDIIDDHITFYHECLIPKNRYFSKKKNKISKPLVLISSPSRMGNHALMSMLDSHPSLPRIAGEDSFLRHSFFKSSNDFNLFKDSIRSKNNIDFIRNLSSFPGDIDKWEELQRAFDSKVQPALYAGVQYPTNRLVITDYQGTLIDVNHQAYLNYLEDNAKLIRQKDNYLEIFEIYLQALMLLDYKYNDKNVYKYMYANSGLRRQTLWLCDVMPEIKIITSIRSFKSYAISHIKSRYKKLEFKKEYIQEAWEHWYHKIIDYFYIKSKFPKNIILLPFEDLVSKTNFVAMKISDFLEIEFDKSMLTATTFGIKTKGNSSVPKDDKELGKFYTPKEFLPSDLIPKRVEIIEEALRLISY